MNGRVANSDGSCPRISRIRGDGEPHAHAARAGSRFDRADPWNVAAGGPGTTVWCAQRHHDLMRRGVHGDRRRRDVVPAWRGALRDRDLLLRDYQAAAPRHPVGIRLHGVIHRRGALAGACREADPRRVGRCRPRAVARRRNVEAAVASTGRNFRRVVGDADLALVGGRSNDIHAGRRRPARERDTHRRERRCAENSTPGNASSLHLRSRPVGLDQCKLSDLKRRSRSDSDTADWRLRTNVGAIAPVFRTHSVCSDTALRELCARRRCRANSRAILRFRPGTPRYAPCRLDVYERRRGLPASAAGRGVRSSPAASR